MPGIRWTISVVLLVLLAMPSFLACSSEPMASGNPGNAEAATPPPDLQQQLVDARILAAAIEAYAVDNSKYPTASSLADLERALIPRYMHGFPQTPFQVMSSDDGYTISSLNGYKLLSGSLR